MPSASHLRSALSQDATLEFVQRLWRTKMKCITLVEKWLAKTSDLEIKAGLKMQLADERRHLRVLSDEIKRQGGKLPGSTWDFILERPLAMIEAQGSEANKLAAYYRGLKAFTVARCDRLVPMLEVGLARSLEQIARDEQSHIRWAEIRLARIKDLDEQRQMGFMLQRFESVLESVWSRPWKQLVGLRDGASGSESRRFGR